MQNQPSVSLSMIVKNEERYLAECLKSVKEVADEIVIIDTGSEDATIRIAELYGAKVSHFDWCGDFSAARNFALQQSSGKWILYLDADERLHPQSVKIIKQLVQNSGGRKIGASCLVNSIDEKRGNPKLMKYTRFFANTSGIAFSGKVHEQIDTSLLKNGYQLIDTDIEIIHIGYNVENSEIKEKAARNLELLLEAYGENPSSYYEYHLGITYEILGDTENSIKYFSMALNDKQLHSSYRGICLLNLAVFYSSVKYNFAQACSLLAEGLDADPSSVMLNLVAAEIYAKAGQADQALKYCLSASEYNKKMAHQGLSNSILGVFVKQDKISYEGLLLSVQNNNQQAFSYFLNDLKTQEKKTVTDLLNKKPLNEFQLQKAAEVINENNIELFLFLAEHFADSATALKLLLRLKELFPDNYKCNIAMGNVYFKLNNMEAAVSEFNNALLSENADPSPYFLLISAYVRLNNFEHIPELLQNALNKYGHIPVFVEKLNDLQIKLKGVLS